VSDKIVVNMGVIEPGDWMRVVTAVSEPVPEPGTCGQYSR